MTKGMSSVAEPTEDDIKAISQQVGALSEAIIGVGHRCQEGKPTVLVLPPLRVTSSGSVRAEQSLFWLSCPALVRAVDRAERDGAIERVQERVDRDEGLRRRLEGMQMEIPNIRSRLLPEEWVEHVRTAEGLDKERFILFETGLIGVSPNKRSFVKCLHAQLADWLVRGDANPIGRFAAEEALAYSDFSHIGPDSSHCRSSCISCPLF